MFAVIGAKIKETFDNLTFNDVINVGKSGILAMIAILIEEIVRNLKNLVRKAKKFVEEFTNIFASISNFPFALGH